MYSSAVFTVGQPLCTQILGTRKLETLRYPMVKTASLCLSIPHFDTIAECDGQTDLP